MSQRHLPFLEDTNRNRQSFEDALHAARFIKGTRRRCLDQLLLRIWQPDQPADWKPGSSASVSIAMDDFAIDVGRSRSTTTEALRELEAAGYIRTTINTEGGHNAFAICWDKPFESDLFSSHSQSPKSRNPPEMKPGTFRKTTPEPSGNETRNSPETLSPKPEPSGFSIAVRSRILKAAAELYESLDLLENTGENESSEDYQVLLRQADSLLGMATKHKTGTLRKSKPEASGNPPSKNECNEWMEEENKNIHPSISFTEDQNPEASGNETRNPPETENTKPEGSGARFLWPNRFFPTDEHLEDPECIQRFFEAISGIQINGKVWWETGQVERLKFFAEVNWSLSQSKSCSSSAASILTASIMQGIRRAPRMSRDKIANKTKPSPYYDKARRQIQQLGGTSDPEPVATSSTERVASSTPEELARNRARIRAKLQAHMQSGTAVASHGEPSPEVDLGFISDTDRSLTPQGAQT